jgi:hypothetical protein
MRRAGPVVFGLLVVVLLFFAISYSGMFMHGDPVE